MGLLALDEGVSKETFEKHSGVSGLRSREAAPNRRTADFGVLGTLRWVAVFRNNEEGVDRELEIKLLEIGSLVVDRMEVDAELRSFEDERISSEDLFADMTGRGVLIELSVEEGRLSDDLFGRL